MPAMPTELEQAGRINYRAQAQNVRLTTNAAQQVWRGMPTTNLTDKRDWFDSEAAPQLSRIITTGQKKSLVLTGQYMTASAAIQSVTDQTEFDPLAYVYDQEALEDSLGLFFGQYVYNVVGKQLPDTQASRVTLSSLLMHTAVAVQDAGRDATSAVTLTSDYYGFVRVLQLPSCSRCAVLAGKEFKSNADFERHPQCDCQQLPMAERYDGAALDPVEAIRSGNVTGLSKADTEAILERDADVSQVINSKSGLYETDLLGERVQASNVGTSSRAVAGKRLGDLRKQGGRYKTTTNTRLSVRQIMRLSEDDPERAKQLLFRHGYIM